jgi:hypothetical protein
MTAVVVLHYERIALTAECCKTLVAQKEPARVLVVDNGSPSHGEEELKAALPPGVEVLRLPKNRGFGGGMNAGMRAVLADPATDSVLFLNNDTRCPPELVGAMRAALAADPAAGLVGCDMEGAGGGEDAPAGYRLGKVFGYPRPCRPGEAPDYVQASCILLPRDVLEAIGGFDEDYRFFFEDADLSLRVRRLGRKFAVAPGVKIFHYGSATIGANDGRKAAWFRTGHRIFLRKWYSFPRVRALVPFLASVAINLLRGRFGMVVGGARGYFAPVSITKR